MDWTKLTSDPNDYHTTKLVSRQLQEVTKAYRGTKEALISALCKGQTMLDIGAGEHDPKYFNEKWEHAIYKRSASSIVAVEINQSLCDHYNSKGFDFRCMDATSENNLGEKYSFIYCGDVIEHVNNPVNLVTFIGNHLLTGGRCIITTPNPFCSLYKNIALKQQDCYFVSNLEHTCWISPNHMLEIIRRSTQPLKLSSIYVPESAVTRRQELGGQLEEYFQDYIFEITAQ